MAIFKSQVIGSFVFCLVGDVQTFRDEQLHRLQIALLGSQMQYRIAIRVFCLEIGALLQKLIKERLVVEVKG